MNIQAEKFDIIQKILRIDDKLLIASIKNLLEYGMQHQSESAEAISDFWEEPTPEQKAKVELSIRQLEAGQGIPHQVVMTEVRKKYNR